MSKTTVFYHLYIPPTDQYYLFPLWIDEQLGCLVRSGLSKHAQVKMCITMPIHFVVLNMGQSYQQMVVNYINERYTFVEILEVRDTGLFNLYEGQTLQYAWQHAQSNDGNILYFHSKGMTTPGNPSVHDWRRCMQYFMIDKWEVCQSYLNSHDVVSVKSQWLGNFWWATCQHLRMLPSPLNSAQYVTHDPEMMPGLRNYRLAFEIWVLTNSPKIHYMHETTVDHYQTFYPPHLYET